MSAGASNLVNPRQANAATNQLKGSPYINMESQES